MKAGSLESLNKVKQEINEMISKAQAGQTERGLAVAGAEKQV